MRLVEIYCSKIFKVFDAADRVDTINDCYWTVRAEPVEEDEVEQLPVVRTPAVRAVEVDADEEDVVE